MMAALHKAYASREYCRTHGPTRVQAYNNIVCFGFIY